MSLIGLALIVLALIVLFLMSATWCFEAGKPAPLGNYDGLQGITGLFAVEAVMVVGGFVSR